MGYPSSSLRPSSSSAAFDSTTLRHPLLDIILATAMENSRLPIEICERIIDQCGYRWILYETSLVCTAWRLRSQYNLFYKIRISSASRFNLLLRTLITRPQLSDSIVKVHIDAYNSEYIPFCDTLFIPLLKKCRTLVFFLNSRLFPPKYFDTVFSKLDGLCVTNLTLTMSGCSLMSCFQFIWSLPALETLYLLLEDFRGSARSIRRKHSKLPTCSSLRSLKLRMVSSSRQLIISESSHSLLSRTITPSFSVLLILSELR